MAASLKSAYSSLAYLKMVTPKYSHNEKDVGVTRIRIGTELGDKPNRVISNWSGSNMDPDSVKRHYRQLNRAGFKSNRDVKGWF